MQERVPPRGSIDRRSTARCNADTPFRIIERDCIGAGLCAYGNPTATAFAQRGLLITLALRILTKPNRSRNAHSREISPAK